MSTRPLPENSAALTPQQAISELVSAVEGWLWFDNNVEHPGDHYASMLAFERCKTEITERVAKALEDVRLTRHGE